MEFSKETPTGTFIIQGQSFVIPKPFVEGHVCTGSEAGVLNQTLAENTRNNWNERVKKAVEEASDEAPFDMKKMQSEIDSYLEEYDFGVRRGRGPTDPVEREALNIAKELVKNALREKGHKLADVDSEDINRLAEQAIAANPDITKEAKRRVDHRSKIGLGDLDVSSVSGSAAG